MKLQHSSPEVKHTVAIFVCYYDYAPHRYLFVEKLSDGTFQESQYDYPSEDWCRDMIEGLQTELNCAPDALVFPGGYHLPFDWRKRKLHPSFC